MNWQHVFDNLVWFFKAIKVSGSWGMTFFVWGMVLIALILFFRHRTKVLTFWSEVRSELGKASWPWDAKETGFKKYKELVDSTTVVVIGMLLLGGYIAFLDFLFIVVLGPLTGGRLGK